jgi:hypothetical protein
LITLELKTIRTYYEIFEIDHFIHSSGH